MTLETLEITYRYGTEITDLDIFYKTLQEWRPYGPKSMQQMERMLENSRGGILAGYVCKDGIYKPTGILRTITTPTNGDLESFANGAGINFDTLTYKETWESQDLSADTVVLADLTIVPDMRGKGFAKKLLHDIVPSLPKEKNVITYSPAISGVEEMHKGMGAYFGITIKNARPSYKYPDVSSMVYRLETDDQGLLCVRVGPHARDKAL